MKITAPAPKITPKTAEPSPECGPNVAPSSVAHAMTPPIISPRTAYNTNATLATETGETRVMRMVVSP